MTILDYARVSTDGQTLDAQRTVLTAAGAAKVFRETASGLKSDRKELAKALKALQAGDTLIVTRLDRLARSTRDLLNILDTSTKALAASTATQADLARRFKVSQSTISRLGDKLIPVQKKPELDADTERAARVFLGCIAERYPVDRAILYGSRARRTHTADSDVDLAVVLNGENGIRSAIAIDMAGIAFDVMLETGILVEALPLWNNEMENPEKFSNPALILTIQREGILL